MPEVAQLDDDEVILRHIPGGTTWQAPGPRITSVNFRPRKVLGETDLSVNRLLYTSPEQLLTLVGGDTGKGSRVAWATAGEVRALGLRVEPKPIEPHNPGHAAIESTEAANLNNLAVQRRLSVLFRFVDTDPPPTSPH